MKKTIFILLAGIAISMLSSCSGTPLDDKGQFGKQQYVGKFRDITIYAVDTPSGTTLYLGVRDDDEPASLQYSTGGKSPVTIPVIIIDGKQVTKDEALKILGDKK